MLLRCSTVPHRRFTVADKRTLQRYNAMLEEGRPLNIGLVLAALKVCKNSKNIETGRKIHLDLVSSGAASNLVIANTLVDMYAKCGSMVEAFAVFQGMDFHSVVSWNCIILGYAQSGDGELALDLFSAMEREGVVPNRVTLLAALKGCSSIAEKGDLSRCRKLGTLIHEQTMKNLGDLDLAVATSLVDMYTKCGEMAEARNIFEKMKQRDSISWNSIILGYALAGDGALALELFERMKMEGFIPDSVTFVAALKACSSLAETEPETITAEGKPIKAGSFATGRKIHRQASQGGDEADLFVATTLVDMYAKCGSMAEAREVFDRIEHPSVVSWTAMILGYAQSGQPDLALDFYLQTKRSTSCVPDAFTYVAALKACGLLGALERGRLIQADISSAGLHGDVFVANSLVDFFSQTGSMAEAEEVFRSISRKNLVSWSALMAGYSFQGDAARVIELFERMRREQPEIRPDEISFRTILTACSHAGLVDKGRQFFREMGRSFGIQPRPDHYNCMIDLLGRANRIDEAVAMAREMPSGASVVSWITVLGACHKWKNVELGRVAFEKVVEMDCKHAVGYVLMANIYGFAGMWEEQARVIDMGRRRINGF